MHLRAVLAVLVVVAWSGCLPDPRCEDDRGCTRPNVCVNHACSLPDASGSSSSSGTIAASSSASAASGASSAGHSGSASGRASSSSAPSSRGSPSSGSSGGARGLGKDCTSHGECESGFCVDGVCCESDCTGMCSACAAELTAIESGLCRVVQKGLDPHDDCVDETAASCGTNGLCDGTGGCLLYPVGTVCIPASCADIHTASTAATCDGARTCLPGGTTPCGTFDCVNGVCAATCGPANPCPRGAFCNDEGTCEAQLPNGSGCDRARVCQSGFCVDGVCCDTACDGTCEGCTFAARGGNPTLPMNIPDGTCGPSFNGTDPEQECDVTAPQTCGSMGTCNGQRACAVHPQGTVCGMGGCGAGNTFSPVDTCNGNGMCVDQGSSFCGGYPCTPNGCATSCSPGGPPCVDGYHCANGACLPDATLGNPCNGPGDCGSGFCVDGVCCDSACNGLCQACSAALKGSGASGACGPIAASTDPQNECTDQGAASCGTNGLCSGGGACALYGAGTICTAATCSSGTLSPDDRCNGQGLCVDQGTQSCGAYACGGTACLTGCSQDASCAPGFFCDTQTSRCTAKLPLGAGCAAPNWCQGGVCVDGYCCNTACDQPCMACSNARSAGLNGICTSIPSGTDPDNECVDEGAAVCGRNGSCNGSNACAFYPAGTTCSGQTCANGVLSLARTCGGPMDCQPATSQSCNGYACNGNACRTSCMSSSDCVAPTTECVNNTCKLPQGATCDTPQACATGFCSDGYCCSEACDSTCYSCGLDSSLGPGACSAIGMGFDRGCAGQCCNGLCRPDGFLCDIAPDN